MWFFTKSVNRFLCLAALLVFLFAAGCMSDRPMDTDLPWSTPATWEGTMPLPGGFSNRYE